MLMGAHSSCVRKNDRRCIVGGFLGVCSDDFPKNCVGDHQDAPQRPDTAMRYVIHDDAVLATPLQPQRGLQ
jgi:hypothetical protein